MQYFSVLFVLLLAGCTGTHMLYGPEDAPSGSFPDLHTVPDRPHFPTSDQADQLEQNLENSYEETMARNERLRRDAGLL